MSSSTRGSTTTSSIPPLLLMFMLGCRGFASRFLRLLLKSSVTIQQSFRCFTVVWIPLLTPFQTLLVVSSFGFKVRCSQLVSHLSLHMRVSVRVRTKPRRVLFVVWLVTPSTVVTTLTTFSVEGVPWVTISRRIGTVIPCCKRVTSLASFIGKPLSFALFWIELRSGSQPFLLPCFGSVTV